NAARSGLGGQADQVPVCPLKSGATGNSRNRPQPNPTAPTSRTSASSSGHFISRKQNTVRVLSSKLTVQDLIGPFASEMSSTARMSASKPVVLRRDFSESTTVCIAAHARGARRDGSIRSRTIACKESATRGNFSVRAYADIADQLSPFRGLGRDERGKLL